MSEQSFLEQRLDASTWPLVVGDLAVLLLFFLAGVLRHHTVPALKIAPMIYVDAAWPFVLGWLVCAPLVGAYSPGGVLVVREFDRSTLRGRWLVRAERVVGFDSLFFTAGELEAAIEDAGLDARPVEYGFGMTVVGVEE